MLIFEAVVNESATASKISTCWQARRRFSFTILRAGMSYEDAAAKTFTSHMAGKYGLTVVTVDRSKLVGEFGHCTNTEPVFSRAGG